MDIVAILAYVADQKQLQDPAAAFLAAAIKSKVPVALQKDVKDLLTNVVGRL